MQVALFLLVLALVIGPCVVAVWTASFLRWPLLAFVVAWLLTPVIALGATLISIPVLRALLPPGNDGTGVLMLPIYSFGTGLIAGVVAMVRVVRRRPDQSDQPAPATAQP